MAVTLSVQDLRFSYGSFEVLKGINIDTLQPGTVTAIIGPNATGKSTLFKCIAGLQKARGTILVDNRDIRSMKRAEVNEHITYLPQNVNSTAVMTVFEAVLLARQVSATWRVSESDLNLVAQVITELGIEHLAVRYLNELSGGQRQMVSIAQAIVRSPNILLLDEPTSSLDLHHQLEVLDIVRTVTLERKMTTLIALHDLSLAGRYADTFVVLNQGLVYGAGAPADVLTEQMLFDVYHVEARVSTDAFGHTVVSPIRSISQNHPATAGAYSR